jgi:hypothetical protein
VGPFCVVKTTIFPASDSQQGAIAKLAKKILEAKQHNTDADTSETEQEIDRYVYALYGLTLAEIKLVEEGVQK